MSLSQSDIPRYGFWLFIIILFLMMVSAQITGVEEKLKACIPPTGANHP